MLVYVVQAGELHDPTWTGRQKKQLQHVQALISFQVHLHSQKQYC